MDRRKRLVTYKSRELTHVGMNIVHSLQQNRTVEVDRGPVREEKIGIAGKSFGILSLPFYLAPRVLEDW